MTKVFAVAVSAAALACGGGAAPNQTKFRLVVPATSMEIAGGDTRTTAPTWGPFDLMMFDDAGTYAPGACTAPDRSDCCPGATCLIGTSPAIALRVCDAERDVVIVDVEVEPLSEPFTDVPTYTVSGRAGSDDFSGGPEGCRSFAVPLDGVSPGTSYAFQVRTRDEWGATTQWGVQASDGAPGWIHQPYMQFTTRP